MNGCRPTCKDALKNILQTENDKEKKTKNKKIQLLENQERTKESPEIWVHTIDNLFLPELHK